MPSPFQRFVDAAERDRRTLTVYASDPDAAKPVRDRFETRNARIEFRQLPDGSPEFLVVRTDDEFVGSIGLNTVEQALQPSIPVLGTPPDEPVRSFVAALAGATFAAYDRRQLLATTREFEDRAVRVGHGELHVGFQSRDAFEKQLAGYRQMGSETDLAIHVYFDSPYPMPIESLNVHDDADELARFWFLCYDGGGGDRQKCALAAEERQPDEFYGVWTYDPESVDELLAAVRSING